MTAKEQERYYQQEIETMSPEALFALQSERLLASVTNCYANIPFYKRSMDAMGVKPGDIGSVEDLGKLPFTTKQDLRNAYPFGLFAIDVRDRVQRLHASSGTTGNATVCGYTQQDINNWGDCFARTIAQVGGGSESIIQIAYGYGLFTGGLGAHEGGIRSGATILPMGSGNTRRQVQMMNDFGSDILACTPSYALLIADTAIEMGYDPAKDFKLSAAILGAEPWSQGMREEIEDKLGVMAVDIYGLSEVMGPGVSCECRAQNGLHVAEDHFIIEILDPETLKPVPDGEFGEVVFTTLTKECSPLLRYQTRDISRILPGECSCGRTLRRMDRISGRTDDMLIIRGVNVFPSQFQQAIADFIEVTNHYEIILTKKDQLDMVELRVETVPDFDFDEIRRIESLQQRIAAELKSSLQISVKVSIVEPKSLVRSTGKAKRVIDERQL
ncbi:MAG: phenylacetate--CoA ligase [Coriobacteriia bacterium]|nr:phenylacetate--CoA ligase [Coriobacteriia bacterium]MCL2750413.1 phenylacetate--CoA ligase [Coriobacteriia bacterium]